MPTPKPAPQSQRRLTEQPQTTHPGWTRLNWVDASDGHELNRQYRGPGGEIISKRQFSERVKSGEIPTISPATGELKTPAAALETPPTLGASGPEAQAPDAPLFDLPDATPASRRAAPGQASAAELALTGQIAFTILTSLLALITRTPELAMSEMETQAIAVPLANIAAKSEFNRRFGRYLADSSDYTLLGYALYAYGFRVVTQVQARAEATANAQGRAQGAQRGFPHVVPTAQAPQPSAAPATATVRQGGADGPDQRTAAASGGIGGIIHGSAGADASQSSRIVGYNPISPARAG